MNILPTSLRLTKKQNILQSPAGIYAGLYRTIHIISPPWTGYITFTLILRIPIDEKEIEGFPLSAFRLRLYYSRDCFYGDQGQAKTRVVAC